MRLVWPIIKQWKHLEDIISKPFMDIINDCNIFVNPRGDPKETTGYDKNLVLSSCISTHAHL